MKCSYCGHELSNGAEFCDKCGMILGFADEKKDKSGELDSEFTQNIFQALDFDDSELDIAAMELPVSDYEETAEVSYNIPEYVSSPEDETVTDEAEEEKSEEPAVQDDIPTIDAEFEAPEYTPVPDVVISAKKASDAIKESNHKKEGRKKKKHNKKVSAETYDIESLSLEETPEEIEKQNEEAFKEAVKAPEIISVAPVAVELPEEPEVEEIPEAIAEPVAEEIPEAIAEPEVEEAPEAIEEPVAEEIPEAIAEPEVEEAPEAIAEPEVEEAPEAIEEPEVEEIPEAIAEPEVEEAPEAIEEPIVEEIPETVEEPVIEELPEVVEEFEEVIEPVEEQPLVIGLFEDIGSASEAEEYEEEEEYEDITPVEDNTEKTKKSKKGIVIAALIFILCVLCAGVYALKDYIPVMAPTEATSQEDSTVPSTEETTEEETTEEESTEETSEEETTEETTEAETTESEETTTEEAVTTEPTSENEIVSTTKPTTTKPTTTKPTTTKPTTTKPTTTKPTTTKPATTRPATTKPATTKPATTKPATTKPNTTTDPYGINDVTVKKPSSYIKSYTGYVTAEGLNMRAKPTTSSDRVLYLSKGADVKVLAKENGFLYVYSNRYGVSGWVSASYISTSRPTETTSKLYTGTVQPDVKATQKVMHTTYSLNIRKGPSTSYPSVQIIATGYPVKVIGSKSGVAGWVYVTDLTYGVSGWVSTAYLK